MSDQINNEEIVSLERSKLSDLWIKEDWLAVWIVFILITIAAIAVLTGAFDFSATKFSTWGNGVSAAKQLATGAFWIKLVRTFVVMGILGIDHWTSDIEYSWST